MEYSGVYTAIVTPFKNGSVDYDAYQKLIERQIEGGVNGIVPCGTTGESPTLSHSEHKEFIRKTVEYVQGRVKVIAGTGSNSTDEAIQLSQDAEKAGVDAVLLVNPYYNKPTQDGLYAHFKAIAEATGISCVLYNIPGRTAVNCLPETISKLAELKNIDAVKEATGDINQASRIQELCGDQITILSGDDSLTLPLMSIGGKGVISVVANIIPDLMSKFITDALAQKCAEATQWHQKLFPLMRSMFLETNPIPVKGALAYLGLIENELRLPLTRIKNENMDQLASVLSQMDIKK